MLFEWEKTIIIYETLGPLMSELFRFSKNPLWPNASLFNIVDVQCVTFTKLEWGWCPLGLSSAVRIQWYQLQAYAFLCLNYSFRAFTLFMLITQLPVTPSHPKKKKKDNNNNYTKLRLKSQDINFCVCCVKTLVFMTLFFFFLRKK